MTGLKKLLALIASGEKVPTIGGLPVLFDNAVLIGTNNKINDRVEPQEGYFVSGWFDTGSVTSKSYTHPSVPQPDGLADTIRMRFYNDKEASSVDYWGMTSATPTRTFTSAGQYVVVTLKKDTAADFYLYDNTNQKYVCKGANVT
jgi:hypothetical protein